MIAAIRTTIADTMEPAEYHRYASDEFPKVFVISDSEGKIPQRTPHWSRPLQLLGLSHNIEENTRRETLLS
jgi:hypothetical protein